MISNRSKVIAHDLTAIAAAWMLAFLARFNFELPPPEFIRAALESLPAVLLLQALVARYFGLYKGMWRFASMPDLWNIIRAVGLGALVVAVALFVVNRLQDIPRSVLVLYPLFLTLLLGGPRLAYRLWKDRSLSLREMNGAQRVIVVGAGTGGERIIRDMLRDGRYVPVGIVDDRRALTKGRMVKITGKFQGEMMSTCPLGFACTKDRVPIIASPVSTGRGAIHPRRCRRACMISAFRG